MQRIVVIGGKATAIHPAEFSVDGARRLVKPAELLGFAIDDDAACESQRRLEDN
jgi:hypothetical protein